MNARFTLDRRGFIVSLLGAGGALVTGVLNPASGAVIDAQPWGKDVAKGAKEFTPWLSIAPDGKVTVMVTHPDIGNGVVTQSLAYVFEELQPKWEDLKAEYASPHRDFQEGNVYSKIGGALAYFSGRSTAPDRMTNYMTVAATAREQLKAAAAKAWNVPASEITVGEGMLRHAGGRSAPFTAMLASAATVKLAEVPQPKPRDQWTFLGKASPAKVQIPKIVDGTAIYGMDVQVPGKVYAALRQSPVMGGTVKSFNADAVKKMPGVLAVVEIKPSDPAEETKVKFPFPIGLTTRSAAVAVIAEHYWQAKTALDALPVVWDDGPGAKWKNTEMMNQAALAAVDQPGGESLMSKGDTKAELAKGGRVVEAKYLTPYCEHVLMEPLNGTCMVTANSVEMWHPSQHTEMAFAVAAAETGVPQESIKVHQTFVGGGFGRRVFSDDARMVVAVAKAFPGRPVHTIWTREETTRQGRYRALMGASMKARLGDDGLPTALVARISGPPGYFTMGISDTAMAQVVPNVDVESQVVRDFHIKTGPYRGPGFNSNIFFVESFLDECAVAAKMDPMDYRIALYGKWPDRGWEKCLRELKDKSGWSKPLPAGHGRGVAIGNWAMAGKPDAGTTCAAVVHLEVKAGGEIKIHRVDVAFDTGRVMNRDAVLVEVEGGTIFGLNMSMNEEINVRDGRVVEGNYDQYPMLRIGDIPEIHVHFGGLSDHDRYAEIGEPPVGPIGPAVANAIFAATGKRVRTQPLRKHDLRQGARTA